MQGYSMCGDTMRPSGRRGVVSAALLLLALLGHASESLALGQQRYVEFKPAPDSFALVADGAAASLVVDAQDFAGVAIAARNLQSDIARVTSIAPALAGALAGAAAQTVLIGTIGHSAVIDGLIADGKLDVASIAGKWESFLIQVVDHPAPGITRALVICGSDKRGTIFGIYDLSEQMGVSPWYYWADVASRHHAEVFVKAGRFVQGEPSVKYRGIFLNDERPDLTGWVQEKFGNAPGYPSAANFGHEFYARLFELILRLKGNCLWPAMWDNAFNEDDPENPRLADEYGIVMGTSHQEPMLRAQEEWDRRYLKEYGTWDYAKYPELLQSFWREGIVRNRDYESLITIGLRGANDTPMAPGGPAANMALLETIVDAQRRILAEEMNADLTQVPQVWCLYKEVMDYYKAGMRVPDDVTLLWSDDNWGNLRRLPTAAERMRSGGAGVYYHFDYHGSPRSYQWINTSPIAKVWDQMALAKQYGADRLWIVNVGHFKGYEFPIEYFMHLAWNSARWTPDNINEYTRLWAQREFGPEYATQIADLIAKYTKYNGRRKPELLDADTYSLVDYREFETVVADYDAVVARAQAISDELPASDRAAFYELVLFPAQASAQLNRMYLAAARDALYAAQGRASAAAAAATTRSLFKAETDLMDYFNHSFLDGRWNHFMDQPFIGYIGWREPARNNMDTIQLSEVTPSAGADMGIGVEGSAVAFTHGNATLPPFDVFNRQRHYIEVFNRGSLPFDYTATADRRWIRVDAPRGHIGEDRRIWISIDWSRAPRGAPAGTVTLRGAGSHVTVRVEASNPSAVRPTTLRGFVEGEGVVSIEPEHFTARRDAGTNRWIRIEDYGRTLSGMRATGPAYAPAATPGKDSACLEYRMYLFDSGAFDVTAIASPTLNFIAGRGLQFAVSLDDGQPRTVQLVGPQADAHNDNPQWARWVEDNANYAHLRLNFATRGYHTLKFWMVDPGVVLQKIIVDAGGLKPSYLGPPESFHVLPQGHNGQ
ncbi:MAG TPA: glycosyl hydrolase 115 family protein [Steroidobacteraceae bacterium]